jgi:serine protease Do
MSNQRTSRWLLCMAMILLIVLSAACSKPDDGDTTKGQPIATKETVKQAVEDTKPPTGGAVASLGDVKSATILIEAQGTFIDPEFGMMVNAAGTGSGFIIDPSGIAVTNNHVVTGAALLKVWIGGEGEPLNAKILGVSECTDLAVIDIEGDGYPFLEWHTGDAQVGLEVYTAGFPLSDPEFTMTKGIVSKAEADGETSWASVDYVLEHDATINPGNSGGPLIDSQGRVVGINYATSRGTNQYFAIKADEATPVIKRLRTGEDVTSIGVNGVAVLNEDGSLSGIWVSSVKSGSPADQTGIKAGDIITALEGLVLATDGTMADYCDILRTHGPEDVLSVEVLRFETSELLEGQLNGRGLETTISFADQVGGGDGGDVGGDLTGTYSDYVTVTDDFQAIEMAVPTVWSEVDGSPWTHDNGANFASIWAAPDLVSFDQTWNVPGVKFNVTRDVAKFGGYVQMLDLARETFNQCELDGRYDYEDQLYKGKFDYYVNCGGLGGASYLMLAAIPIQDQSANLIFVEVQIVMDEDLEVADTILNTFQVVGALP